MEAFHRATKRTMNVCSCSGCRTTGRHSPGLAKGESQISGLAPTSVVNTGDYKHMDPAPLLHGGGSSDDQCALRKRDSGRETGVGVQPHVKPHVHVNSQHGKVEEESRKSDPDIKR